MTTSSSTVSEQFRSQRNVVDDPSPLSINPDGEFGENVPVFNHTGESSLKPHVTHYDESPDNSITLGNVDQKINAAFEVLQKSQAVLVEIEPWFVHEYMGSDDFDRWEPFFVAFPETAPDQQMKFSNLAPLSEVAYRIRQRDSFLEQAQTSDAVDNSEEPDPVVKAQIEEQKAFCRYTLDSCYNGPDGEDGVWIDQEPVHAIHAVLSPWAQHLIIGARDNGELYCGRGAMFDKQVDVAIGLNRRAREYNGRNERKVAVFNDKDKKNALNGLPWDDTHARYIGQKGRWEVDLAALETVVRELLSDDDIQFVSMHRITEKAYVTHMNPGFRNRIHGYPGFEE